jgi:murein DD-endopeptidase MepM/ murein hydrolase activator NlpD
VASESIPPARGTSPADFDPEERRGWLSHGIAALAISALGLAVAASVSLTTNAQTTAPTLPQTGITAAGRNGADTGQSVPTLPGQALPGQARQQAAAAAPELEAFTRRASEIEEESRDSVRTAIVEERAAQRSEDLAESADDISRTAVERGKTARLQQLAKADRARRLQAVKIAQERTRRAIQARVTAEVQRELAAAREREEARRRAAANASEDSNSSRSSNSSGSSNSSDSNRSSNSSRNSNSSDSSRDSGSNDDSSSRSSNNDSSGGGGGDGGGGGGARSPVPGAIVGASFGATGAWSRYHTGLDFRAGFGTPIRAVTSGTVVYAGNKGNWAGNHVAVRHSGGYTSMSSHMQSMSVSDGQSVRAGQIIGYVGSTGRSFGAHLHFEIYPPGVQPGDVYNAINPIPWLRARGINTN